MNLKKIKWNHYINYMVIGAITVVLSVMTLTGNKMPNSLLFLLEKLSISMILAVSLSLVVGFLGELSLGHAGFMCVGAYIGGKVAALLVPTLGNGLLTFLISLAAGSAAAAITEMKKLGCKNIKLMVLLAAPEGVALIQKEHPDVDVYCGAVDEKLNEKGYIVPGLGDAGDRIFGTK